MLQKKVFSLALFVLVFIVAGLWLLTQRSDPPQDMSVHSPAVRPTLSTAPSSDDPQTLSESSPSVDNHLQRLAQHHCAKLQSTEQMSACRQRLRQAAEQGDLDPRDTDFDAQACDSVTDPTEQHLCHARLGLDFALSTGDMEHCKVIPLDELKAICRISITVNEIKKLYALENELAKRPE